MTTAATTTTAGEIGARLSAWRRERGMHLEDVAYLVRHKAAMFASTSSDSVRRYESGVFKLERADAALLVLMAEALGHDAAELGPEVAEVADALRRALEGPRTDSRCFEDALAPVLVMGSFEVAGGIVDQVQDAA